MRRPFCLCPSHPSKHSPQKVQYTSFAKGGFSGNLIRELPGREIYFLFSIIFTVNLGFTYSLPPNPGGIAMDGNSAVMRHGCRIDGDPVPASNPTQTVRKMQFKIPLIRNRSFFQSPRIPLHAAAPNIPAFSISALPTKKADTSNEVPASAVR